MEDLSSTRVMSEALIFLEQRVFCQSFIADVLSGFITSFVFLFALLFLFRPRIKIAHQISTHIKAYGGRSNKWYCFKIINRSLFRAFDLRVEVIQKIPMTGPEGKTNHRTVPLTLVKDQYNYVAPFRIGEKSEYALWFLTTDDISTMLNDNEHHTSQNCGSFASMNLRVLEAYLLEPTQSTTLRKALSSLVIRLKL